MARPPGFKPIKKGGTFHVYVPGRGFVDLGTTDETEAQTKCLGYANDFARTKAVAPAPQHLTATPGTTSQEMLKAWIHSPIGSQPGNLSATGHTQQQSSSALHPTSQQQLPASASVEQRVTQLMPDEKRKKLADLCARLASRVTILLAGATVRVFGRNPDSDVDKEEKEVLQEGLGLWLDEAFVEHPPRPWMVVAGATAGIGIGMYVGGTPIKKEGIRPPQLPLDEPEVTFEDDPGTSIRS